MHEENKTACTSDDNVKKTHSDLSQFIQVATYKLEHNSQMSETI